MSLAGLLPPLCDEGNMLVDGGYVDNLPVSTRLRNCDQLDAVLTLTAARSLPCSRWVQLPSSPLMLEQSMTRPLDRMENLFLAGGS